MEISKHLKALAGTISKNFVEGYTLVLIIVGMPLVAFMYVNWQFALTVSIVAQIILGILALRVGK